MNVTAVVW